MQVLPTSRRLSTSRHIVAPAASLRLALIPLLGLAFLSVALPAAAQNTWMFGGHPIPLWSNAGAWSLGVVPDGSTDISIPNGSVGGDVSFTNRNTLTIGAPATLTILSPTTVTNSGGSGFINNSGSLVNSGTVVNASFGTLNNGGTLTNNNTLINELGGQFSNSGTLDNFGTLDNRISGFIVNTGNLNNQSGGFIINDLSSTIENDHSIGNLAGATFSNSGTLNGSGIFVNSGTVDNSGQLNNVVFNLGGTINNTGGSIRLGDGSDIVGGTLGGAAGAVLLTGAGATATLDGSNNLGFGALTIRGTYTGDVGTTTNILGTINNQGNLQVNSGGLDTHLTLTGNTILQGGGTVTLVNVGGGLISVIDVATSGLTLTNVDNTIQGAGRIFGVNLVNQAGGTINANVAGQSLEFTVISHPLINAGLMEATGGGTLFVGPSSSDDRVSIDNSGGTIVANGGTVRLNLADVTGGTITASNGGIINLLATVFGGTLNNVSGTLGTGMQGGATLDGSTAAGAVTIQGTYTNDVGSTTNILGTINNQGNLQVNSGGLDTHLTLTGNTILQGGGAVTLANVGGVGQTIINAAPGGATLTNVDNTIQGAGLIDFTVILVNQSGGTINANVAGQSLGLSGNSFINAGLLEATGGGTLNISGAVGAFIDNRGGTIAANGGNVVLLLLSVTGGAITASNGGIINLLATTVFGGTLNNVSGTLVTGTGRGGSATLDGSTAAGAVTIQGTYTSDVGSTTNILGTINNQGNLQVNSGGLDTHLTLNGNTILQGGGAVTLANLGGSGVARIESSGVGLTLNNVDNTIQGVGLIDGGPGALQILNQAGGTIRANTSGGTLELLNTTLTNAGTVQVDAGSVLRIINTPFTQTGGKTQVDGLLSATLGESVSGGTMLGTGTINGNVTMTGGTMLPGGPSVPGTLTINGDFLQTGSLFDELIGSTGNGLLFVNGNVLLGPSSLLDIDLLNSFTLLSGETFTIMDFSSLTGTFANAPTTGFQMDGFNWTIAYNTDDIVLDAVSPVTGGGGGGGSVPEPGTGVLLLSALALGALWFRTRAPIAGA